MDTHTEHGAPQPPERMPSSGVSTERTRRALAETASRPARVAGIIREAERLFPGEALADIRQNIRRALDTPQWGPWHNEGFLMDTHIALIFQRIEEMARGEFATELPTWLTERLTRAAREHGDLLKKYALLHDIEKPNTLVLRFGSGEAEDCSWEEWQARVGASGPGTAEGIVAACEANDILSIGYFRAGHGGTHGARGAAMLASRRDKLGIPEVVLFAIENHEIAYGFENISALMFLRHFEGLTDERRDWLFAASYSDSSSSLSPEQKPHLDNFRRLALSARNCELLAYAECVLCPDGEAVPGVDRSKLRGEILRLKRTEAFIGKGPEEFVQYLRQRCVFSRYDPLQVRAALSSHIATGRLDRDTVEAIVATIDPKVRTLDETKLREIRASLRAENKLVTEALRDAEILEG